MPGYTRHPASFKDPSGFVFQSSGKIYRQVNKIYAAHYDLLIKSGLYDLLQRKNLLLRHEEINENLLSDEDWHLTLLPEQIPFVSYPYEWCFEQLKDAALLTLEIVKISIEKGMILKDATAFNIQFHKGRPVLIDTLSFEKYDETLPWIAYRQFCENFLFPLWLSHYHKMNFQNLLSVYPDGIPAVMAAKLLPAKSLLNPGIWLHVNLPDKMSRKNIAEKRNFDFSKKKLLNIVTHLQTIISKLDNSSKSTWSNYYKESQNNTEYIDEKEKIIRVMLGQINGKKVLDLGANNGHFSMLAAENNFIAIAVDNDEQCINNLYKKIKRQNISGILPLCIDIANPSSPSGFAGNERVSFNERIQADVVMALALVHHLVIGKNIPLGLIASYFSRLAPQLIIEFVPKEDDKVQLLLQNKKDIYPAFAKEEFEKIFQQYFKIVSASAVPGTSRCIYLMRKKEE
jgi:hypothetical protein